MQELETRIIKINVSNIRKILLEKGQKKLKKKIKQTIFMILKMVDFYQ